MLIFSIAGMFMAGKNSYRHFYFKTEWVDGFIV